MTPTPASATYLRCPRRSVRILAFSWRQPASAGPPVPGAGPVPRGRRLPRSRPFPKVVPFPEVGVSGGPKPATTSLANTQQWLGAHGYGELAARAVTVVNGVSRRTKDDVLRAESVARGRCRAIVRVPWDDLLSSRQVSPHEQAPHEQALHEQAPYQQTMQPQTRLAYTALAGVLIAGLAATNTPNTTSTTSTTSAVPGRNPGEHAD